jgi:filamentous hemagglutinin family protein
VLLSGLVWLWALLAVSPAAVTSAITSDGTLGTTVTQSGTIYTITEGTRPGNGPNLFHSFDRFSVGTGDTARFSGPAGITNILSRVTGGQPSEIDGRLQSTIPGAHLFLLNPNGIMVGPHAGLNVQGSFHVGTADYLRFADGATFFATPGQASVLTVAAPTAFGFLGNHPAAIAIQRVEPIAPGGSNSFTPPPGETLSVVGGDITIVGIVGSGSFHPIIVTNGQLHLASVASPGEVVFRRPDLTPDLQVDSFTRLGRIDVSPGVLLGAGGNRGGTVLIRSDRLLVDRSVLFASYQSADVETGMGIDLHVTGEIVIRNGSEISIQRA